MSKPFDASLSTLIDERPADWAAYLAARAGVTPGPFAPVETDISRTVQADRAFRTDGPSPEVVHLELESSSRLGIPPRPAAVQLHPAPHDRVAGPLRVAAAAAVGERV